MKFFPAFLLCFALFAFRDPQPHWQNNFEQAKQSAAAGHKYILLNFSGSDWCVPCIRMHKEIFDTDAFTSFADEELIMVNADFPRLKKNQLPAAQQEQNDMLAERYNRNGSFPFTALLTADGKVVKTWDGFPKESLQVFIAEIKSYLDGNK
jgi:thioredoxin-related protein